MFRGKNRLSPPEDAVDERLSHGKTGSVHLWTLLMKGYAMEKKPEMSWPYFGRTGDVTFPWDSLSSTASLGGLSRFFPRNLSRMETMGYKQAPHAVNSGTEIFCDISGSSRGPYISSLEPFISFLKYISRQYILFCFRICYLSQRLGRLPRRRRRKSRRPWRKTRKPCKQTEHWTHDPLALGGAYSEWVLWELRNYYTSSWSVCSEVNKPEVMWNLVCWGFSVYSRMLVKSHWGCCEYAVFDMSRINEWVFNDSTKLKLANGCQIAMSKVKIYSCN